MFIYLVYTRYIIRINYVYTMYISTYVHVYMAFAGFRGLHRAGNPAPPDPPETVPDLCYERDFGVSDTRSLLDEFLSKMSKSVDN